MRHLQFLRHRGHRLGLLGNEQRGNCIGGLGDRCTEGWAAPGL